MRKVQRFYKSDDEFQKFYYELKGMQCPHCALAGFLVLHGFLYGYCERKFNERVVRGRRVYCNNRFNRLGCGKTFSLLKSSVLKRFRISATSLWRFLERVVHGDCKIGAFRSLGIFFSYTTVYRLYKTFQAGQTRVRTLLARFCLPPQTSKPDPVIQTIEHLHSVFKNQCPVTSFQERFQVSFL